MTDYTLPDRLRALAESLVGDEWEHPIDAVETCRNSADELDRLYDALGQLVDYQNGPPLHRERKKWYAAMAAAHAALGHDETAEHYGQLGMCVMSKMTTPDDAVRELLAEIERLRAELAEAQARIAWLIGDQTYQPVPGKRRPQ